VFSTLYIYIPDPSETKSYTWDSINVLTRLGDSAVSKWRILVHVCFQRPGLLL